MTRGKHIALYGIPRCGKTTQADILVQTLKRKEYRAEYIRYPIYEQRPTGPYLNEFLNKGMHEHMTERELQLWFTLNRLQYQPTIKDKLEGGTYIITENYAGMSLAYGLLAGVEKLWLEAVTNPIMKADVSIVLNSERVIEMAQATDAKTLRELQSIYNALAGQFAWYRVNGDKKMMEVHMAIWDIVKKVI